MSNLTKEMLIENFNFSRERITKIDNPIISRKILNHSKDLIENQNKLLFEKDVFCSVPFFGAAPRGTEYSIVPYLAVDNLFSRKKKCGASRSHDVIESDSCFCPTSSFVLCRS